MRSPISRPALPRASSAMSGFFFWGSIERAGGVGVVEPDEPELLGRPQHDLLADPRQVDADQREREQRLGDEVAVARGVEGVVERARRSPSAVALPTGSSGSDEPASAPAPSGDTSARRRASRAGRRHGRAPRRGPSGDGPAARAGPAAGGCSRAGRRRPTSLGRAASSASCRSSTAAATGAQRVLHEQPERGGHLVVARPPGVQLGAGRAGQLGDPPLDGGVDVLVGRRRTRSDPRPSRPRRCRGPSTIGATPRSVDDAGPAPGPRRGPGSRPGRRARAGGRRRG